MCTRAGAERIFTEVQNHLTAFSTRVQADTFVSRMECASVRLTTTTERNSGKELYNLICKANNY